MKTDTKPNIDASTLPKRCPNCDARGTKRHFVYGLAKGGVGTADLYCPVQEEGRDAVIRLVTKRHGAALHWSRADGWATTGRGRRSGWAAFWEGFREGGGGEATYVYHFYDRQGRLLYVGITNDTRRRWEQHAADKPWWHLVARKERVLYSTREEAERVEEHQIRTHRPMYNRAMNGWLSPRG